MADQTAAAAPAAPPRKGFPSRLVGVFVSPGETFEEIARRPTVLAPMLLLAVGFGVVSYLIAPIQGKEAAEFTAKSSFFERIPEAQREEILEAQRNPSPARRAISAVGGPAAVIVIVLFFSLLLWGLGHLLGGEPTFKGVLSIELFASMVSVLANFLVKLPFILSRQTFSGVTFSPAAFLADAPVTSTAFRLLALLDLFALWGVIVGGIGFARVSRLSTSTGIAVQAVLYGIAGAVTFAVQSFFM